MPASPTGLRLHEASTAYLQSLSAFFFGMVTAQIANVLCKRSSRNSLFSPGFLTAVRRSELLIAIANWRPPRYATQVKIEYHVRGGAEFVAVRAFFVLAASLLLLPFRYAWMLFTQLLIKLERPLVVPFTARVGRFLERHYVLFNLISNPLIDLGILFELLLCYLFFYTPLSRIYYFASLPWHVYLFAFHGTFLVIAFEELKKYYRRKGYALEILG